MRPHGIFLLVLAGLLAACARGPEVQAPESVAGAQPESIPTPAEREVMAVLDEFMAAFNALDVERWEATFHFPHYRLASGAMHVLEAPGGQPVEQLKAYLKAEGWHRSEWARREIVHFSDTKVHVDTAFTRFRQDGSAIGTYDSLYVLTKEEGRWGVKLRSSFAR